MVVSVSFFQLKTKQMRLSGANTVPTHTATWACSGPHVHFLTPGMMTMPRVHKLQMSQVELGNGKGAMAISPVKQPRG